MQLSTLLAGAAAVTPRAVRGDAEVVDVTHDSRQVRPGWMFCCVRGARSDGHDHAPEALELGATALLVERWLDVPCAQVLVDDVRAAMGHLAAVVHGQPGRALTVVAITGTNGKTTTTHLVRSILDADGLPAIAIGTLSGARTTPEATDLHRELAAARDRGVRAVALEATSIGLAMHRLDGVRAVCAGFSNLSVDHLDFHGSMEAYFAAKRMLFTPRFAARGVINADDPYGQRLLADATIPVTPFSRADAEDVRVGVTQLELLWRGTRLRAPIGGEVNVLNVLLAVTCAAEVGVDRRTIAAGLDAAGPVPGRFEPIEAGQPFPVIVDYAHTPDGLEAALGSARALAGSGRVIVVFGCGGDRDHTKRPAMGEVATRLADVTVLTSDNPRSEDPGAIIAAVRAGIPDDRRASVVEEPDRRSAIAAALATATDHDLVLIAGRGHESHQEVAGERLAFDDRQVARELLGGAGA